MQSGVVQDLRVLLHSTRIANSTNNLEEVSCC